MTLLRLAWACGLAVLLSAPAHPQAPETDRDVAASDKNSTDAITLLEGYAAYKMGRYDRAREIWQPLADAGNPNALLNLSTLFDQGDDVDKAKAADLMRRAAERGYAPAQLNYGLALEKGAGVPRDMKGACHWFTKVAEQGDADAAFNLGVMMLVGAPDVPADKAKAKRWLSQAAASGNAQAAEFIKKAE
jgi:TPR repeat protein